MRTHCLYYAGAASADAAAPDMLLDMEETGTDCGREAAALADLPDAGKEKAEAVCLLPPPVLQMTKLMVSVPLTTA